MNREGLARVPPRVAHRLSGHLGAPVVCALFLAVGIAVLDDYGTSVDEYTQRDIAARNASYLLGNEDGLPEDHNRFYGVVFELPLLFVERALGLQDSRDIYLGRHLLTHLFFLTAGFFCYLLVRRLFDDRRLALAALLLFLLHPRLYAHSFFNSKDLPFLSMFMIALYLTHRAFDRDTVRAFLLCGAGAALLAGIRIPGVMLFPAVLALRAADFRYARGWKERKHVLTSGLVFLLAGALTLYAVFPALWRDPAGGFIEAFSTLAHHPTVVTNLFQGELILSTNVPPHYVPTWFAITTPPATLLFGFAGVAAVVHGGVTVPGDVLRNTRLRFGFLLVGALVLPVLAVVLLDSHLYDGWRQMYFLHVPFCLLAVFGLHRLASFFERPSLRAGVYGLAGIGLGAVVVEMARIHPHQQVYFNPLVDRTTPEYLSTRYDMDYWRPSHLQALEYVLERSSASPVYVRNYGNPLRSQLILSPADRRRLAFSPDRDPDFYVLDHRNHGFTGNGRKRFPTAVHTRKVYGNTISTVATSDLSLVDEATAGRYREAYRSAAATEPLIRSGFDLHLTGRTLVWVKEACRPGDLSASFFLMVVPAAADASPRQRGEGGFVRLADSLGVKLDGRCLALTTLPDYRIRTIRTGQHRYHPVQGWSVVWEVVRDFGEDAGPP